MPLIALLTDFGSMDWYVASMKGVIHMIAPGIPIVDLNHEIPPGGITEGAFVLSQCYRDFPRDTVFICVVDPEVGTARHGLAMRAEGYCFVGPDNGIFSFLLKGARKEEILIHRLENEDYLLHPTSSTFHGRDVFAPVGAYLAKGVELEQLGPKTDTMERKGWPEASYRAGEANGEIIFIDRFGNAISNLEERVLKSRWPSARLSVLCNHHPLPLVQTFAEVERGEPLAYFGSGGFLEIAVNGGSAARELKAGMGSVVACSPASPRP